MLIQNQKVNHRENNKMFYSHGTTLKVSKANAVNIPTARKVMTAYKEALEREAKPLIPYPEVHPCESLVPNPTRNPPNKRRHHCKEVVKKPAGDNVIV